MPIHVLAPAAAAAPSIQTLLERVDCDAFALIAAMNPCPCGCYGDPRRACTCAPGAIGRYQKRQSTGSQEEQTDQLATTVNVEMAEATGIGAAC
jgi:predicted ATPase with chaperone activity